MSLMLALLIACADPAENVTPAEVVAPPAAPVEAPAAPAAPTYAGTALTATGSLGFTAAKITRSHDASFGAWSGALYVDGDRLTGLTVEAQVASLATDSEKLDKHLRGPDFFDVERWPTATFASTSVADGAPEGSQLAGANATITGDLRIRDVSRTLSFPAVIEVGPTSVKASSELVINRQDFGVAYPGKPDDLIKDEVVLRVSLEAPRAPAEGASATP